MHRIEFGSVSPQVKGWPGITRGVEKASLVLVLATLGKAPID